MQFTKREMITTLNLISSVSLSSSITDLIVKIILWISDRIIDLSSVFLNLFPNDPFNLEQLSSNSFFTSLLPFVNWIIPFDAISVLLFSYASACSLASTAYDTTTILKDVVNDAVDAITL